MQLPYLKSVFKKILPGKVIKYLVGIKLLVYENRSYWKGVYKKYDDVPSLGNGYFEENLAIESKKYTQYLIDSLKKEGQLPYSLPEENTFLPLFSCALLSNENKIKVLELGGGMGIGFLSMKACLGNDIDLDYCIIETPLTCKGGRELFEGNDQIRFFEDFPSDLKSVDIVFVKSALQYFKDYKEVLKRLASYKPRYILFIKLSAGENLTFVTAQRNLPGTVTPFWFFNIKEVITIMSSLGYSLIFRGVLDRAYNQDNFFSRVSYKEE
jgi:putative methyltransferase (TIGR04325 family)